MEPSSPARVVLQKIQRLLATARFFSFSLLLHFVIVLFGGSFVLIHQNSEPPDFVASEGGLLAEEVSVHPPDAPAEAKLDAPAPAPATNISAPAIDAIATTSTANTAFAMNTGSAPIQVGKLPGGGADGVAKAIEGMGKGGGTGRAGGMSRMVFGRMVEAKKLGVVVDVSGSAHPHLAVAIQEIEKAFADALIVLTPGCGMGETKGRSAHEIRKFASLSKRDLEEPPPARSTAEQLAKAFKIGEFEKLVKRPAMKDRLFVSWFEGGENKGGGSLTSQTLESFDFLIKKGVDSIYWFADFRDPVSGEITAELAKDLKRKKVVVYLHNFAGDKIPPEATLLAEATGGTINAEKPK